jgi:hypothetical protein
MIYTDIDYHTPIDIPYLSKDQINLIFIHSFDQIYEIFQETLDDEIINIPINSLYIKTKDWIKYHKLDDIKVSISIIIINIDQIYNIKFKNNNNNNNDFKYKFDGNNGNDDRFNKYFKYFDNSNSNSNSYSNFNIDDNGYNYYK